MNVTIVIVSIVMNVIKIASPPIANKLNTKKGINSITKDKMLINRNFFKENFCITFDSISFEDIFITNLSFQQ